MEYYRTVFHPGFDHLKQEVVPHDPDEPVILHRRDIIDRKGPFKILQNPASQARFNEMLLAFVGNSNFTTVTAVIDKKEHLDRYGKAAFHPYNYCLAILMERFCGLLRFWNAKGDVLAESRGRQEDTQLKNAFDELLHRGTQWHSGNFFKDVLTNHTLRTSRKSDNVAGLQLADLMAHPGKQDVLAEYGRIAVPVGEFRELLAGAMRRKYNRRYGTGQIKGYGMILI